MLQETDRLAGISVELSLIHFRILACAGPGELKGRTKDAAIKEAIKKANLQCSLLELTTDKTRPG